MYILDIGILLIPALSAVFLHDYFCHGKLTISVKFVLLLVYAVITGTIMYAAAWCRGIKGTDMVYMTLARRTELTVTGCVLAFAVALAVCIVTERDVTAEKLKRYIGRFMTDMKKYFRYAVKSAGADLRSEVANAYLDWLWWVIEPFCMMLIYTFIFGSVFQASEEFFPVFIFSGLAMWNFFSRGVNVSVNIIRSNKGIISRVYLPKFILYLARMFVNGFKMLVSFAIVLVMMLVFRVPVSWNILYIIPVMAVFFLLVFGIGTILLHFGVYVNDLSYITGIVLSMLMYFTGIFYAVGKRIPAPFGELMEQFNPVAFCIASMRNALLYRQEPRIDLLVMWGLAGLALSALGVYTIYRNENAYVKVI